MRDWIGREVNSARAANRLEAGAGGMARAGIPIDTDLQCPPGMDLRYWVRLETPSDAPGARQSVSVQVFSDRPLTAQEAQERAVEQYRRGTDDYPAERGISRPSLPAAVIGRVTYLSRCPR